MKIRERERKKGGEREVLIIIRSSIYKNTNNFVVKVELARTIFNSARYSLCFIRF